MRFLFYISFFLCFSCKSQRKNEFSKNKNNENNTLKTLLEMKSDDLEGKWILKEKRFSKNGNYVSLNSKSCIDKNYWEFKLENKKLNLEKVFFADNCKRKISSQKTNVEFSGRSISYFSDDVYMNETLHFISKKAFILYQKDNVIDGKLTTIEEVYQKE